MIRARRHFIAIAALAAFSCGLSASADEPLRVEAMTFNIRYDNRGDGANQWSKRTDIVAAVVNDRRPDFVGVQEAQPHQAVKLRELWSGYDKVGRSREKSKLRGEATPIYYRTDRWKVIEHETFWLSDTPSEPGSTHWGNDIPRIATVATFEHLETKRRVTVMNTHFDHRSQPSREKSAALIMKRLKKIAGPVVVTGDFNAGEDNAAIKTIKDAGFVDTFREKHPKMNDVGTFNGFEGRKGGAKIDYVFVRRGVQTNKAGIVHDQKDGRYPSDHFPVWATVVFE